jgi:PleD family two-component response regulator
LLIGPVSFIFKREMKPIAPNREKAVLVIDDDEGECYLVEDILGEEGFNVDIA